MKNVGRMLVTGLIAVAMFAAIYALGFADGRDYATVSRILGPLPRCLTVFDRYQSYERVYPRPPAPEGLRPGGRMPHLRHAGVSG